MTVGDEVLLADADHQPAQNIVIRRAKELGEK
jgi:hypothetical protein